MTKPIRVRVEGKGGSILFLEQAYEYDSTNMVRVDMNIRDGKVILVDDEFPSRLMFPDKVTIEFEWNAGE